MSQATVLYTRIRYSHKTYNDIRDVEKDLEIAKASLEMSKATISKLCIMTEPSKFSGDENPMFWIDQQYNEALENIEERSVEIYKLEKLIDEWDQSHDENGLAIPVMAPTNDFNEYHGRIYKPALSEEDLRKFSYGQRSFVDGDHVKTIHDPDGQRL